MCRLLKCFDTFGPGGEDSDSAAGGRRTQTCRHEKADGHRAGGRAEFYNPAAPFLMDVLVLMMVKVIYQEKNDNF